MYYVDRYLGKLVKEKDPFAPPERYYEYIKGQNNIVIERYIISYNQEKFFDFSYTTFEDKRYISIVRENLLNEHKKEYGTNPLLYSYIVPPKWYEEEVAKID